MCSLTAVKTARCLFLPDLKDTGIPILSISFLELLAQNIEQAWEVRDSIYGDNQ